MDFLSRLADALWNPWLLGLFLVTGLIYSVGSGWFQIFGFRTWWRATAGSLLRKSAPGRDGLSPLQALATALAIGGPGAVFWMWVSALLGMMTGYGEKLLAVKYQRPGPDGGLRGGPMYYIRDGLGSPLLAACFCLACIPATLAGGNLVQSSSIASSLEAAFGLSRLSVGLVTALLAGLVMVGGLGRIAAVSSALVPIMAVLYLGSGGLVLLLHWRAVPGALGLILSSALSPAAALGGGAGWTVALRYGVARGVFTNEAGLGTSAIAHGAARADCPAQQGLWGIFEVFLSTLVVCTVTALVILVSGLPLSPGADPGAPLTGPGGRGGRGPVPAAVRLLLHPGLELLRPAMPGISVRPAASARLPGGFPPVYCGGSGLEPPGHLAAGGPVQRPDGPAKPCRADRPSSPGPFRAPSLPGNKFLPGKEF